MPIIHLPRKYDNGFDRFALESVHIARLELMSYESGERNNLLVLNMQLKILPLNYMETNLIPSSVISISLSLYKAPIDFLYAFLLILRTLLISSGELLSLS